MLLHYMEKSNFSRIIAFDSWGQQSSEIVSGLDVWFVVLEFSLGAIGRSKARGTVDIEVWRKRDTVNPIIMSNEQNNKTIENGSEKDRRVNTANMSLRVSTMLSIEGNHILATKIGSEIPKESGWSKQKKGSTTTSQHTEWVSVWISPQQFVEWGPQMQASQLQDFWLTGITSNV